MNDVNQRLALTSAKVLRNLPSNVWDEFLEALAQHSRLQTTICIQSPADQLATAQGRAQNGVEILRVLTNCIQLADKIEGK